MTCAVICWKDYTTKWQEYFDYINIMSYDRVMGNSSTPGQHASYNDFVNDMNYWITKFQSSKIKRLSAVCHSMAIHGTMMSIRMK